MTIAPTSFPAGINASTHQAKQDQSPYFFGMTPTATAAAGAAPHMFAPPTMAAGFGPNAYASSSSYAANWRENDGMVQGLRTRNIVLIEQMLSNHAPHDVLTQVPENVNWHSKTFQLAVKIERLMFNTAATREDYLNENTLRVRVQNLSRNLIQLRKRKNMISEGFAAMTMQG